MATEATLARIGGIHVFLVALAAATLVDRSGSVLAGGAAIGGATLAFWAIARGLVAGVSRIWLIALGVLKFVAYLALVGATFAGALPLDGVGFAAGVTCFPIAVVAGTISIGLGWRTV
jgi:hypothetical protein